MLTDHLELIVKCFIMLLELPKVLYAFWNICKEAFYSHQSNILTIWSTYENNFKPTYIFYSHMSQKNIDRVTNIYALLPRVTSNKKV